MSILLCISAFVVGSLAGAVLFGILPGLVFAILFYGGEAYRHPEIAGFLIRPAALFGGTLSAIMVFIYRNELIKYWSA